MNLDFGDVFGEVFSSIIGRGLLFLGAIWLGCSTAAAAMLISYCTIEQNFNSWNAMGFTALLSPLLLVSTWALLNIPFLVICMVALFRNEGSTYKWIGTVIAVESLMVMLGWGSTFLKTWPLLVCGWLIWLVLVVMLETGVWLLYQKKHSVWVHEMAMLRASISQQRAMADTQKSGFKEESNED